MHPVAAAGFSSVADLYERARPSYPAAAVAWLAGRLGLRAGTTVVDLGAGTGKLTRLLVATGARVIAVEPLPEVRALLAETSPAAEALAGTAEQIPLADGSADAITVAQAFHWFDLDHALPELHRVLKPGGNLAAIWNSRDLDDPIQRELEDLLAPHRREAMAQREGTWQAPLKASPLFGDVEERRFRYEQQFTTDQLCDRVGSTSFVAAMSPVERDALLVEVRALAYGLEEPFPFPYQTEVYVVPRLEAATG